MLLIVNNIYCFYYQLIAKCKHIKMAGLHYLLNIVVIEILHL